MERQSLLGNAIATTLWVSCYYASNSLAEGFGGSVQLSFFMLSIVVFTARPSLISFVLIILVPLRVELPTVDLGPFHLLWHEVILISCGVRLALDLSRKGLSQSLYIGRFAFMVASLGQASWKGFQRALLPGVVLRDAIGSVLPFFFYAGQFLKRSRYIALAIRCCVAIWVMSLYVRIILVTTSINETALQVFYGDQAAILSSLATSFLIVASSRSKSGLFRNFVTLTVGLFFFVTVVTGGRIASIAVVGCIFLSYWMLARINQTQRSFAWKSIVVGILLLISSSVVLRSEALSRFEELFSGLSSQVSQGISISSREDVTLEGSLGWRMLGYLDALSNWMEEPIMGIGWGTPLRTPNLVDATYDKDPMAGYFRPGTVHNTFLVILTGSGILGIIGIFSFIFGTLKRIVRGTRDPQSVVINAFWIPFFAASLMVSMAQPLFSSVNAAWLWCMYGFWYRYASLNVQEKEEFGAAL